MQTQGDNLNPNVYKVVFMPRVVVAPSSTLRSLQFEFETNGNTAALF